MARTRLLLLLPSLRVHSRMSLLSMVMSLRRHCSPRPKMALRHESQDTGRKRQRITSLVPRTRSYCSARPLSRVGMSRRKSRRIIVRSPRSSGSPGKICLTRSVNSGTARRSSRRPSTNASSRTMRSDPRMCGAKAAPPLKNARCARWARRT